MITAHQLYNYITDHASTYGMKPLRMSKAAVTTDSKKGTPELHEYALVSLWNRYRASANTSETLNNIKCYLLEVLHSAVSFLLFL